MLFLLNTANLPVRFALVFWVAFALIGFDPKLAPAQEQYPAVARLSFVSGPVTYSRGDDPDEWDDAIENVPLTIGDRIYSPQDGRAELQLSSGNFVRLAPRTYFSTLNLSDDIDQFYLGEGVASFNIRRMESDELIEIDTPNVSVTLDEPGLYRIVVDEDGNSRITVRRGRATVAASGQQIAVENSEIRVYGVDSPRYEIVGLPATDAFDRWVSERDDRYERSYSEAYRYASEDIIGVEDLSDYGRWEQIPEHGYAWTPTRVAVGWLPFSDGRWFWQDPWGWTWISNQRWGWATSHYGRWTPYRSRWYWVPIRPRTRVRYVPAVVEFVRVRDHVGWFPLHPRDRYMPWWERRDRRNVTYVNRTHVTIVNQNTFISARPINKYIVRDSVILRDARSGRFASEPLPIPNRSSLRVISESGVRRGVMPSTTVINRAAVVRTAPPAPPPTFREKLPEIQKNQGKPIAPSAASILASKNEKARVERVRIRPAVETKDGGLAPRNPGATAGPAPQPLTAARGRKLATRESPFDAKLPEKTERVQKSPSPQPPAHPSAAPRKEGTAIRPEAMKPSQRQAPEAQKVDRPAVPAPQKQEADRKLQEQQKQPERNAPILQQQKELERRQELREQLQKQQELERKQQSQQREEQRKIQLQQRQGQERNEQVRQQQLQERQAQQRQQEIQLRQQQQQREQERNVQIQQRQEHDRAQQLRQQQAQERQVQQPSRQQQQQERIQQLRQQQLQGRQLPQPATPTQPGQP